MLKLIVSKTPKQTNLNHACSNPFLPYPKLWFEVYGGLIHKYI